MSSVDTVVDVMGGSTSCPARTSMCVDGWRAGRGVLRSDGWWVSAGSTTTADGRERVSVWSERGGSHTSADIVVFADGTARVGMFVFADLAAAARFLHGQLF